MKKTIIFVLTILIITVALLNALTVNDEWGAWFKESMSKNKDNTMEPENKQGTMYRWKNEKEKLISDYKKFLRRDMSGAEIPQKEIERREPIVNFYYYDETDSEINTIVDFFIYVVENDPEDVLKFKAIKHLTTIAFKNNNKAKSYIISQKNNTSISHRLNLQFHLANITLQEDQQSINYLMFLITKAQDVETTDIKFSSLDEGAIAGYLNRSFFSKRYSEGLDYDYALPLLKQIIYSRSISAQRTACLKYYYQTNREEMRKIYEDCWGKVQNKSTPREEFINALYGLQALYSLSQRNIGKYKIGFKGILTYFATLGGKKPIENGFEYIELTDENRITKEEKQYFQNRLRSK